MRGWARAWVGRGEQGRDYYDQLSKIVALIGKPGEDDMAHLQYESARSHFQTLLYEALGPRLL